MNAPTTIRGGAGAISASHRLLARRRRGDRSLAPVSVPQIREQISLAVARVMAEASLYDPTLAALAVKQAQGDLVEAAFLLRAFRSSLERIGFSNPIETVSMRVARRVVTTHKDVPGGQLLGSTYDYTHRLLDFSLLAERDGSGEPEAEVPLPSTPAAAGMHQPRCLVEPEEAELVAREAGSADAPDLTRDLLTVPCPRELRLQALARGDEGFLVGLAYSTMRGFGGNHPFVAELVCGLVEVELFIDEIGETVCIGEIELTECRTIHPDPGTSLREAGFTRGYGLVFGHSERKAIAMAIVDRALRTRELGDDAMYPAQDEEFVLMHADNLDASGLVQHLKLPHYVDFEASRQMILDLRRASSETRSGDETL